MFRSFPIAQAAPSRPCFHDCQCHTPLILRVADKQFCSTSLRPPTAVVTDAATSPSIFRLYRSTAAVRGLLQKGFFQFFRQLLAAPVRTVQNPLTGSCAQKEPLGRTFLQNLRQARYVFFFGGLPKTARRVLAKQCSSFPRRSRDILPCSSAPPQAEAHRERPALQFW